MPFSMIHTARHADLLCSFYTSTGLASSSCHTPCHDLNPRQRSGERWLTGPTTKKPALHGLLHYETEREALMMGTVLPQLNCHPTTHHCPPPPMLCTPTPRIRPTHTLLPCLPLTELHQPQHPNNDIDIPPPSHPTRATNCTCPNWCRPSSFHP